MKTNYDGAYVGRGMDECIIYSKNGFPIVKLQFERAVDCTCWFLHWVDKDGKLKRNFGNDTEREAS